MDTRYQITDETEGQISYTETSNFYESSHIVKYTFKLKKIGGKLWLEVNDYIKTQRGKISDITCCFDESGSLISETSREFNPDSKKWSETQSGYHHLKEQKISIREILKHTPSINNDTVTHIKTHPAITKTLLSQT